MLIDLNDARKARAARREGSGGAVRVPLGAAVYELPNELPITLVDRLLDPDIEIAQLLLAAFRAFQTSTDNTDAAELVVAVLGEKPELPYGIGRAVYGTVEELFGPEQWASFHAQASVDDLFALIRGLVRAYGAALGEAWRSRESSETGGATSNATSSGSTESTPAGSGFPAPTPITSASAG